jgi:hypothetical protein
MQLEKNERSIFAYFPSSTKAQKAADELKQANIVPGEGYIQVDRISRHAVVNDSDYNNPINNAATLHGITHYSNSDGLDHDLNPLLAANDSESGRGVYDDNFAGKAFMVTLVTSENNVEKAVAIMKAQGGTV